MRRMKVKEATIYFTRSHKMAKKSLMNSISYILFRFNDFPEKIRPMIWYLKGIFLFQNSTANIMRFHDRLIIILQRNISECHFLKLQSILDELFHAKWKKVIYVKGWSWPSLVVNDSRKCSKKYLNWTN